MADEERPVLTTLSGADGGATVEITAAEDGMTVWGKFLPPHSDQGKLLVHSELVDALQSLGVVHGIDERSIQQAIFQCNMEKKTLTQVVLARGTLPKKERPAFLKLEAHIYNHHFMQTGDVQIDFKEYSPFVIVKKGELLARAVLPQAGEPGMTVFGKELPTEKKTIKLLKPGPNTLFAHGKVFSRVAGRFVLDGDVFDVSDTLEITGGVDYSTGNLFFPGSIVIKGVVQDGFKVVAGGSITVSETLDASEVLCQGDLTCNGGIIGKKPGVVRVGGKVEALFIENCQMEVLANVEISRSLLHTRLSTNGNLSLGEGGKIVSSSVVVKGSVSCSQLGNENGPCHLIVGTDFVVLRKLEAIRSQYKQHEEEIFKLRARLAEVGREKLQEYEQSIHAILEKLVSEMNQLTALLFNPQPVSVTVTGEIFEGSLLEMGYARLQISSRQKGKTFRLADDQKSIQVEKL